MFYLVRAVHKFCFRFVTVWTCEKWQIVESDKCSKRGLMFLTGPVCFLWKAGDEIKDPTHAVKVKVIVLNQQDERKAGKYAEEVVTSFLFLIWVPGRNEENHKKTLSWVSGLKFHQELYNNKQITIWKNVERNCCDLIWGIIPEFSYSNSEKKKKDTWSAGYNLNTGP